MGPHVEILLVCIAVGVLVGLMAGLLGIGGGLIIVPALVFMLHYFLQIGPELSMPIAVATSLSTVIFTGISSARTHYKLGNIDTNILLFCAIGIAFGATLGAHFASAISGMLLKRIFAVLVIIIALQMIFGSHRRSQHAINKIGLGGIGLGTGFLSALMGVGGGAILVPILVWFQIAIRKAIGCASFCGIVIALFGTTSFIFTGYHQAGLPAYSLGYVYLPATLGIVLSSVFFAPMGAKLGQRIETGTLKKIFAGFLVLVSIRMIIGLE